MIQFAKRTGKAAIRNALWLFYAAQDSGTPVWVKVVIYGVLAYFISPIDAIPDITPIIGYTDDLGVLAAAVATVSVNITDEVKAKASQELNDWFDDGTGSF